MQEKTHITFGESLKENDTVSGFETIWYSQRNKTMYQPLLKDCSPEGEDHVLSNLTRVSDFNCVYGINATSRTGLGPYWAVHI